jgi:hypothetical protein
LILTQVSDGGEPVSTYRVLFQIEDLQHFDVTWEESEGGVWHKDPPTVCRKLGQRTRSRHKWRLTRSTLTSHDHDPETTVEFCLGQPQ